MSERWIAVVMVAITIMVGLYVLNKPDPTMVVHNIDFEPNPDGKETKMTFIGIAGINSIKLKLTRKSRGIKSTKVYERKNGDIIELVPMGLGTPDLTPAIVRITWK